MLSRLSRSADFERVLQKRSHVQSAHFALHHLAQWPAGRRGAGKQQLSTRDAPIGHLPVDNVEGAGLPTLAPVRPTVPPLTSLTPPSPGVVWLGAVVPKRHARRSVTRSLLKRQIRAVASEHAESLAGGLWVVRLRAPFDRAEFPSAASVALQRVVRAELAGVLSRAGQRAVD